MTNEQMDAQVMAIVNSAGADRCMDHQPAKTVRRTKAKTPREVKAYAALVVSFALAAAGFACLLCEAFIAEIVLMMLALVFYGVAMNVEV